MHCSAFVMILPVLKKDHLKNIRKNGYLGNRLNQWTL